MAKFKGGGLEKSIAGKLMNDINNKVALSVQNAAIEITNGLVEAGPAWSGEFSASWDVVPPGQTPAQPRGRGRIYHYDKRNFPLSRFEKAINNGVKQFEIVNTSPHAAIALDEQQSTFRHPSDADPLKDPVQFGFRPQDDQGNQRPSLRWDIDLGYGVGSKPNAMITAEPDWLGTYSLGGGLNRDLGRGVTIGFNGGA